MKIKITYESPAELSELLHRPLQEFIDQGVELKASDNHPPFKHAYLNLEGRRKGPIKSTVATRN